MPPPRYHDLLLSSWLSMLLITTIFALTTTTTTTTFLGRRSYKKLGGLSAEQNESEGESGGVLGNKSYNDGALYNFHMMTQAQKIRDYSAKDTYVDTNSLWNLAWHDSFVLNGLSDFVPPLTDTLNILVVEGSGAAAAPSENDFQGSSNEVQGTPNGAFTTSKATAPVSAASAEEPALAESTLQQTPEDSSCSFLAAVFDRDKTNGILNNTKPGEDSSGALDVASYDCVMDRGLMADLCAPGDNREDMGRLLWEATKRIRENGIYVANTPPLSSETKEYLTKVGELLGLQWEFDLDGISDSDLSVSVARKYWKYEFPSFDKLAKVDY